MKIARSAQGLDIVDVTTATEGQRNNMICLERTGRATLYALVVVFIAKRFPFDIRERSAITALSRFAFVVLRLPFVGIIFRPIFRPFSQFINQFQAALLIVEPFSQSVILVPLNHFCLYLFSVIGIVVFRIFGCAGFAPRTAPVAIFVKLVFWFRFAAARTWSCWRIAILVRIVPTDKFSFSATIVVLVEFLPTAASAHQDFVIHVVIIPQNACYQVAGWRKCGTTKAKGLIVLEKFPEHAQGQP